MSLNKFSIRSPLIIGLLFFAIVPAAFPQVKASQNDQLSIFEKNIEAGKLNETEKPLLQFALSNPRNTRALELLARLRFRQGRLDEAQALYKRGLVLDPKFWAAKVGYATVLIAAGQTETARTILNEIDERELAGPTVLLDLAQTLTLVGEYQRALSVIEGLPANVRMGDALPIRAVSHIQLGDMAAFEALIPEAKRLIPAKPVAAVKFAEILVKTGRRREAVDLLRSLAAAFPKNARVLAMLAKTEIADNDFSQARIHLSRAAALDPQLVEVWSTRAALETAEGSPQSALQSLDKALTLAPNSTEILSQMVVAAMRANQPRKALDAAEKLIKSDPDDPDYLYLHGAASLQNGSLGNAKASLERFTAARPNDSRGCIALGLTLTAQKGYEAARAQFGRCLEIDASNFEAKYQLGLLSKVQGDTPAAIRLLEEVTAAVPNDPLVLRDLGTLYLQAGMEAKARSALERSVAIDPKDAGTHFQLSRLYNMIGEPALARKHLEQFQKLKGSGGISTN
jgi:tetratricopeptide (TPR) repeat protein